MSIKSNNVTGKNQHGLKSKAHVQEKLQDLRIQVNLLNEEKKKIYQIQRITHRKILSLAQRIGALQEEERQLLYKHKKVQEYKELTKTELDEKWAQISKTSGLDEVWKKV